MTARARVIGSAVAALVLGSVAAPADAHSRDRDKAISFHSHFDDKGFLTGFQGLDPSPPGVPQDAVFHGTSTVTGPALSGSVSYTFWGHPAPDGSFVFHTYETLTGVVRGCGRGQVSYTVVGQTGGAPPVMTLTGTVAFVAGSGTGGLRGVRSGHGTLKGTTDLTTANSGEFDGEVRCRH